MAPRRKPEVLKPALLVFCGTCVKSILSQAKAYAVIGPRLKRGEKLHSGSVPLCPTCCERALATEPAAREAAGSLEQYARAIAHFEFPTPRRKARR